MNVNKMFKMKWNFKVAGILGGIILYILVSWKAIFKMLEDFPFSLGMLLTVIVLVCILSYVKYRTTYKKERNELILYEYLGIFALVIVTLYLLLFLREDIPSNQLLNNLSPFLLVLVVMWIVSFLWGFQIWLKMWHITLFIFGGIFIGIYGLIILQSYRFDTNGLFLLSTSNSILSTGLVIISLIPAIPYIKISFKRKVQRKNK